MLFLCNGEPRFAVEGDQIILTLPSGKDKIEIAITLNHLFAIEQRGRRAVFDFYKAREQRLPEAGGDVVAFSRKRKGGP